MKINKPPYFKDPLQDIVITMSFDVYEYKIPERIDDEGDGITTSAITTGFNEVVYFKDDIFYIKPTNDSRNYQVPIIL